MTNLTSHRMRSAPLEINSIDRLIGEIEQFSRRYDRPIVVALDGGSGAGKSTIAKAIQARLGAVIVHLDDFYTTTVPESSWPNISFDERLKRIFEWERVRAEALEPLLQGKPARWQAFDFEAGLGTDGTYRLKNEYTEAQPSKLIILDGNCSTSPILGNLVDLTVLIDVDPAGRRAHTQDRDNKDFSDEWHSLWDGFERYYFSQVRPPAKFDIVLKNQY